MATAEEKNTVQELSAKEVTSSLWSRNASEKCRLGITDTVSVMVKLDKSCL